MYMATEVLYKFYCTISNHFVGYGVHFDRSMVSPEMFALLYLLNQVAVDQLGYSSEVMEGGLGGGSIKGVTNLGSLVFAGHKVLVRSMSLQ